MPKPTDEQLAEMIAQLTRKLVDDGLLIEAGWVSLRLLTLPPDTSTIQVEEMRNAFFAGAQHLLGSILSILDDDSCPSQADLNRMDLIHDELDRFGEQLKLRITQPQGAA